MAGCLIWWAGRLVGWLAGCSIGGLVDWLAGWLVVCLAGGSLANEFSVYLSVYRDWCPKAYEDLQYFSCVCWRCSCFQVLLPAKQHKKEKVWFSPLSKWHLWWLNIYYIYTISLLCIELADIIFIIIMYNIPVLQV